MLKEKCEVKSPATGYPSGAEVLDLRPTDSTFFNLAAQVNRFSPPRETEGTAIKNIRFSIQEFIDDLDRIVFL